MSNVIKLSNYHESDPLNSVEQALDELIDEIKKTKKHSDIQEILNSKENNSTISGSNIDTAIQAYLSSTTPIKTVKKIKQQELEFIRKNLEPLELDLEDIQNTSTTLEETPAFELTTRKKFKQTKHDDWQKTPSLNSNYKEIKSNSEEILKLRSPYCYSLLQKCNLNFDGLNKEIDNYLKPLKLNKYIENQVVIFINSAYIKRAIATIHNLYNLKHDNNINFEYQDKLARIVIQDINNLNLKSQEEITKLYSELTAANFLLEKWTNQNLNSNTINIINTFIN